MRKYRIAIIGAMTLVGQELIKILEQRDFPMDEVRLYSSDNSPGTKLFVRHEELPVAEMTHQSFKGIDIAFFAPGTVISRHFAPVAARAGTVVIDNSTVFRMDENVPLVVPEINLDDVKSHKGIIACPSCSSIQLAMVLYPLHKINPIKRIIVDTYQSVSGTGSSAMEELTSQSKQILGRQAAVPRVYPHQIAFNLLPEIDVFLDTGYTQAERRMMEETRKIMHTPELAISATCVRVPVFIGHSEAVHAEFTHPITADETRQILSHVPGIKVLDDPSVSLYPQPWQVAGTNECYVGRIRKDASLKNGLAMWLVTDNTRKGSALNAVQIAEEMIKRGWLNSGEQ